MTTEKVKILKLDKTVPLGGRSNDTFTDGEYEMHRDGSIIHVLHKASGESFSFHINRAIWWKPFFKPLTKEQLAKPEKEIVGSKEK
jgi:hypothetical protein